MPRDPSRDVLTLHPGDLESFTTGLIEAGFHPRAGDRHYWVGPVDAELARLTSARDMVINIRDGWPYQHPYVFVDGLVGKRHVNPQGNVCLWDEGEEAYEEWLSLAAIRTRIAAWCADQAAGAPDPTLDAHLYFEPRSSARLISFDLELLQRQGVVGTGDGAHAELRATVTQGVYHVGTSGNLAVAWYRRATLPAPPASFDSFQRCLTSDQQSNLRRFLSRLRRSQPSLALLTWDDGPTANALGLQLNGAGKGRVDAVAVQVARTDESILRLRAGPDAPALANKHVVVFGVGAIGSEIAVTLARCGVGHLTLLDAELLRPGNLTRHAASGTYVGLSKAEAVKRTIHDALPHVRIEAHGVRLWDQRLVAALAENCDLLIEATGNRSYADLLSRVAESHGRSMLSAALYRGGAIAKVGVQAASSCPIWQRSPVAGFPNVPAGAKPAVSQTWETGCGAPVNNAPPWATLAAAALATHTALDVLTGRLSEDTDVFKVFEPVEEAPFDNRGVLRFSQTPSPQ